MELNILVCLENFPRSALPFMLSRWHVCGTVRVEHCQGVPEGSRSVALGFGCYGVVPRRGERSPGDQSAACSALIRQVPGWGCRAVAGAGDGSI